MNRPILLCVGSAFTLAILAALWMTFAPTSQFAVRVSDTLQSSATDESSDFTPPTERLENANPGMAGARQLLLATSADGTTFTPTGEVLTAQGNVPDAVVTNDGTIFVYYIGQSITNDVENTVVAISEDDGDTWTYHLLDFVDLPSPREPSDPDVVLLPDGTFRMFYTDSIVTSTIGIRYADSTDGLTFTYGGIALEAPLSVADSTTFFFDGLWTMLVIDHTEGFPFKQYRATSTDGKTFTFQGFIGSIEGPEGLHFLSNPLPSDTALQLFGFPQNGRAIQAFTSEDAITWNAFTQPSLAANARSLHGGTYLQDLTVAKLDTGTYLMVYVADMPE